MRKCKDCGNEVEDSALVCSKCGSPNVLKVEEAKADKMKATDDNLDLMKCPSCGKTIEDKSVKCPQCGFDIPQYYPNMQNAAAQKEDSNISDNVISTSDGNSGNQIEKAVEPVINKSKEMVDKLRPMFTEIAKNKLALIGFGLAGVLLIVSIVTGVSSSSNAKKLEEYKAEQVEAQAKIEAENEDLQEELNTVNKKYTSKNADYETLSTQFSDYKEKMKPYEEMQVAEANAKKAEAEAAVKAQQEAAEAAEKEKQAQADATEAVKKVWDFEKGVLASGASRSLCDEATNKVNALTDENTKSALNQAIAAASDSLTAKEQAEAEEEAKRQAEEAKRQAEESASIEQKNALNMAKSYLSYTAFSYKGLIDQLKYEGFSDDVAAYGADNCGADWNEQAAKMAQNYLDYTSFSREGLLDQLIYEGFSAEQAEYGVSAVGY